MKFATEHIQWGGEKVGMLKWVYMNGHSQRGGLHKWKIITQGTTKGIA
jgi:hypothetical protein